MFFEIPQSEGQNFDDSHSQKWIKLGVPQKNIRCKKSIAPKVVNISQQDWKTSKNSSHWSIMRISNYYWISNYYLTKSRLILVK